MLLELVTAAAVGWTAMVTGLTSLNCVSDRSSSGRKLLLCPTTGMNLTVTFGTASGAVGDVLQYAVVVDGYAEPFTAFTFSSSSQRSFFIGPGIGVRRRVRIKATVKHVEEVQMVTVVGSSGTWDVAFDGQSTTGGVLTAPTTAGQVQAALESLSNIAAGSLAVTLNMPTSGTNVYTITFTGTDVAGDVAQITAANVDLAGGTPSVASTTTAVGSTTTTYSGSGATLTFRPPVIERVTSPLTDPSGAPIAHCLGVDRESGATDGCSRVGGDWVIVHGSSFGPSNSYATVIIGSLECPDQRAPQTDSEIWCRTPPGRGTMEIKIFQGGQYSEPQPFVIYDPCGPGDEVLNGSHYCTKCPAGKARAAGEVSNLCSECALGDYCPVGALYSENDARRLCSAGSYCPVPGVKIECSNHTHCPTGSWLPKQCIDGSMCGPAHVMEEHCPPGQYCIGGHAAPCDKGTYAPSVNMSACLPCQKGRYARATGMAACHYCEEGKYAESPGSRQCTDCGFGKVANVPGSPVCKLCGIGLISVNGTSCGPCPPSGVSCSAGIAVVHPNYWFARGVGGTSTATFAQCMNAENCVAALDAQSVDCTEGYAGPACGACSTEEPGYARLGTWCVQCPSLWLSIVGMVVMSVGLCALFVLFLATIGIHEFSSEVIAVAKLFLSHLQVVGILCMYRASGSGQLVQALGWMVAPGGHILSLDVLQCVGGSNFYAPLMVTAALAPGIFLAAFPLLPAAFGLRSCIHYVKTLAPLKRLLPARIYKLIFGDKDEEDDEEDGEHDDENGSGDDASIDDGDDHSEGVAMVRMARGPTEAAGGDDDDVSSEEAPVYDDHGGSGDNDIEMSGDYESEEAKEKTDLEIEAEAKTCSHRCHVFYPVARLQAALVFGMWIAFPHVLAACIAVVRCVEIGDEGTFLRRDSRRECFDNFHIFFTIIALISVVVVCVIFPFAVTTLVMIMRKRLDEPKIAAIFGIVYDGYSRESLLTMSWEAISMSRKALLVLVPLVSPEALLQSTLASGITIVSSSAVLCIIPCAHVPPFLTRLLSTLATNHRTLTAFVSAVRARAAIVEGSVSNAGPQ